MSETTPEGWRDWPEDRKRAFLERLRARAGRWEGLARPAQRPPAGDWYLWALIGGRARARPARGPVAWRRASRRPTRRRVGDRRPDVRRRPRHCVEGPSGLLDALRRRGIAVAAWNRSLGELRLASGAVVRIDGDDGALRLQGHNFRRALCDELGLWRQGSGERTWEESLLPAVRLADPRIVVATTPKPTPLMRRLLRDPEAHVTRMTTFDNSQTSPRPSSPRCARATRGPASGDRSSTASSSPTSRGAVEAKLARPRPRGRGPLSRTLYEGG